MATLDIVLRTPEALASLLSHLVLVSDSPEPHLPVTGGLALFHLLRPYSHLKYAGEATLVVRVSVLIVLWVSGAYRLTVCVCRAYRSKLQATSTDSCFCLK